MDSLDFGDQQIETIEQNKNENQIFEINFLNKNRLIEEIEFECIFDNILSMSEMCDKIKTIQLRIGIYSTKSQTTFGYNNVICKLHNNLEPHLCSDEAGNTRLRFYCANFEMIKNCFSEQKIMKYDGVPLFLFNFVTLCITIQHSAIKMSANVKYRELLDECYNVKQNNIKLPLASMHQITTKITANETNQFILPKSTSQNIIIIKWFENYSTIDVIEIFVNNCRTDIFNFITDDIKTIQYNNQQYYILPITNEKNDLTHQQYKIKFYGIDNYNGIQIDICNLQTMILSCFNGYMYTG